VASDAAYSTGSPFDDVVVTLRLLEDDLAPPV